MTSDLEVTLTAFKQVKHTMSVTVLSTLMVRRLKLLDAWDYVGQMATAAMRNWDVLAFNCTTTAGSAIIDVNDTNGIIIGMCC